MFNTSVVSWFEEGAYLENSCGFVVVLFVLLWFCLFIGLFVVVVFVLLSP